MKYRALAAVIASLMGAPALAMDHGGHQMAQAATADAPLADAVVKKVDKAAGKVTLAHGPLVNLDMPGMTMAFRVKDAAWLDKMKEGDKIRFVADRVNGAYTVIRYEPAK